LITVLLITSNCSIQPKEPDKTERNLKISVAEKVNIQTSDDAIQELKNGNKRFIDGKLVNTNHKQEIEQTKDGQKPHSVILNCMDSRVPPRDHF
jgi:hypothetical protein